MPLKIAVAASQAACFSLAWASLSRAPARCSSATPASMALAIAASNSLICSFKGLIPASRSTSARATSLCSCAPCAVFVCSTARATSEGSTPIRCASSIWVRARFTGRASGATPINWFRAAAAAL
eukprot:scaffold132987_cov30-Tisochrysis_lutea.AAC.3